MGLRFGRPLPWLYWRWRLAERMGWSLEYVDSLSTKDVLEGLDVLKNRDKAIVDERYKAGMGRRG